MLNRTVKQRGFSFLVVLFALVVFGLGLSIYGNYSSRIRQREKEDALLRVGHDFVAAIEHYYQKSPGAMNKYPQTLQDLMDDTRFVGHAHHLREVYRDPVTGGRKWGLVSAADGGVRGVYSLSSAAPLRTGVVDLVNVTVGPGKRYSDWHFVYNPDVIGNNTPYGEGGNDHPEVKPETQAPLSQPP